jgi:WD40 repeat protein
LLSSLAFHPDGWQLAGTAYQEDKLYAWDLRDGRVVFANEGLATPTCVAYSPNGQRLATTGFDNRVRLWDSATGQEALTLPSLGQTGTGQYNYTARVAFSPDGRRVAAIDWQAVVSIWDCGSEGPAGATASAPANR